MLQIQVLPDSATIRQGTTEAGKAYKFITQTALLKLEGVTKSIVVSPPYGVDEPYPAGQYTLAPGSFYVKDGRLGFSPKLQPVGGGTK